MDGITEPVAARSKWALVTYEAMHWLLFSVLVSLGCLAIFLLVAWVEGKNVEWVSALKSGGLLTYSTTLVSRAAGDYVRNITGKTILSSFCVAGLIATLIPAITLYVLILESTVHQGATVGVVVPMRVASCSLVIAGFAAGYSLFFTLYVKTRNA